jgi:hypothetical protein
MPAAMPIATVLMLKVSRLNKITMEIITMAIEHEPRNVLRQFVNWVDFPPNMLVSEFPNAVEKEAISPII